LEIEYKIKRAFKNIAKYEASSEFKEKILAQISENLMYCTLKFSIFRELLSLLERNTLYLIIFFFLIPFIMFPIYLGILELFNRIGEVTTKVEALSLFLTTELLLILNLAIALPIFLLGLWLTFKFVRD
jgi:hypothetical protein